MKKILWKGTLALTVAACLTACGDDSSSGASHPSGSDLESIKTSICDIKKADNEWVVDKESGQNIYVWNGDRAISKTKKNYGSAKNCTRKLKEMTEMSESMESSTTYSCEGNILVSIDSTYLAGLSKNDLIVDVNTECNNFADEERFSAAEYAVAEDTIPEEDLFTSREFQATCDFEKSDDVWKLVSDDGVMTVDWTGDEPVASTVQDMGEHTTCALIAEIYNGSNNKGESATCEGGVFTLKDSAIYKGKTKDEVYDIVTTNCKE